MTTRVTRYLEIVKEYEDQFNNARVAPDPATIRQLAMQQLESEFQSQVAPNTLSQPSTFTNVHQKLQAVTSIVGKFAPDKVPIYQFLGTFESCFEQITGQSPVVSPFTQVKSYLQPLLTGVAYSELQDPTCTTYPHLRDALLQRFGKTEDEVITQLLSFRQADLSLTVYIDRVQEMCSHAKVQPSLVLTALKQNLHPEYANALSQFSASASVTSGARTLSEYLTFLRKLATDFSLRSNKRFSAHNNNGNNAHSNNSSSGSGSAGNTGQNKNCAHCGRSGHNEDNCWRKKHAVQGPSQSAGQHFLNDEILPPAPEAHPPTPSIPEHANYITIIDAANASAPLPQARSNSQLFPSLARPPTNVSVPAATTTTTKASLPVDSEVVDVVSVDFIQQCLDLANAADPSKLPDEEPLAASVNFMHKIHVDAYTQVDAGIQVDPLALARMPKIARQLTPLELLSKIRVTSSLLDFTKYNPEFRVHACAKLIQQLVNDNMPIVVPQSCTIIPIEDAKFTDVSNVAEALRVHAAERARAEYDAHQQSIQTQVQHHLQQMSQQQHQQHQASQMVDVPVQQVYKSDTIVARNNYLATLYPKVVVNAQVLNSFGSFQRPTGAARVGDQKAFAQAVQEANHQVCWRVSQPRNKTLPPPIDRTDIKYDLRDNPYHYMLELQINSHKIKAIFDTGASFTCASQGLADLLGWKVTNDLQGSTVSGIEGTRRALTGRLKAPIIAFTEQFEIEVTHIVIVPSQAPLFLLGNDIFSSHKEFTFLQLKAAATPPVVEIWDAGRQKLIEIPCISGPSLHG